MFSGAGIDERWFVFGDKPADCADERSGGKPAQKRYYRVCDLFWHEEERSDEHDESSRRKQLQIFGCVTGKIGDEFV